MKGTTMKGTTICKECEFAERQDLFLTGFCLNKDAPISDFVRGTRSCSLINKGKCQFFKGRDEDGSVTTDGREISLDE